MESLKTKFDELRRRLKQGRGLNEAGDDPVFYLVFPPEQMLAVKRLMKQWVAKLNLEGWKAHEFSMAGAVNDIFRTHDLREVWLSVEGEDPLDFDAVNETLRDALTAGDALQHRIEEKLGELADEPNAVLFITDLEALHPYMRVGTIEQRLQGRFTVPTAILYPGVRSGETTLKFLGIYPEDGNYRSVHI